MTNIKKILDQYLILLERLDAKCDDIFASAPEIPCKNQCFNCCKQIFPVTFVEAFYISEGLKKLDSATRRSLRKTAEKINKKIVEKNPQQFEKQSVDRATALNTHGQFARFLHRFKFDCPALEIKKNKGNCSIYQLRNHDCRNMGFAFDASTDEIIGCQRFARLKHLASHLMPFNYLYPEKMALDNELIAEVTAGGFTPNIFYLAPITTALTKNFASEDWIKFFMSKNVPAKETTKSGRFQVIIGI